MDEGFIISQHLATPQPPCGKGTEKWDLSGTRAGIWIFRHPEGETLETPSFSSQETIYRCSWDLQKIPKSYCFSIFPRHSEHFSISCCTKGLILSLILNTSKPTVRVLGLFPSVPPGICRWRFQRSSDLARRGRILLQEQQTHPEV